MQIQSKYLVPKGFSALTIFPFVFFKWKEYKLDGNLINHENIHLRQQLELLIIPFFIWYGIEFIIHYVRFKDRNLAYRNISFEKECYRHESDLNYIKSRKIWGFLNYL